MTPQQYLNEVIGAIAPVDEGVRAAAEARQLELTKPPGSLGRLETVGNQLAAITGQCPPPVPGKPFVALFAGDHGVVAQRISPWPQEVTVQMAGNIMAGGAAISALSRGFGATLSLTDVGVAADTSALPGVVQAKVRPGTDDISIADAMTPDEAIRAVVVGVETVEKAVADGHDVIITGDMGIGNTTASAAVIAAFTGRPAAEMVGRGAGSDDAMLARKRDVVCAAVARAGDVDTDPLAVFAQLGGLEIAAIAGSILGAARHRVPVIVDGVIASAAALLALRLAPACHGFMVAGHIGVEPGIAAAQTTLGLKPLVDLDLRLGEGSGAIMALPVVQSAARILGGMATFAEAQVHESEL